MTYGLFITILVILCAGYVAYALLTTRPERTLYVYLCLWAFVPKAARVVYFVPGVEDWPAGITTYTALEAIAICGIAAALLGNAQRSIGGSRLYLALAGSLPLVAALSIIWPLVLGESAPYGAQRVWQFVSAAAEPQDRLLPALSLCYASVLAIGCVAFIRTQRQVNVIFGIFIASGIELAAECVVFQVLGLSSGLSRWAVNASSRFNSLVFTAFDVVGVASVTACAALCYYIVATRKRALLALVPVLAIPVLYTFQRSTLLSFIAVIVVTVVSLLRKTGGPYLKATLVVGGVAFVLLLVGNVASIGASLGGEVRPDYTDASSTFGRQALVLRGLDVMVYIFPFGAGPGMLRYAMNIAPETFGSANTEMSKEVYLKVANGVYVTDTHDAMIEFVGEHGMLGFMLLGGFFFIAFRNLRKWLQRDKTEALPRSTIATQTAVYAVFAGWFAHGLAETATVPPAVMMLMLYLSGRPFEQGGGQVAGNA